MMYYLTDYLNKYGTDVGLYEYKRAKEYWALPTRARHAHPLMPVWLQTPGGLRESTTRPHVASWELKPGYYWPEIIH